MPAEIAAVLGHVIGQPLARSNPVRLPLEDRQMLDLVDAGVDDLHRCAACTDDRHPLAVQVQRSIPLSGVNAGARERLPAR